MVLELCAIDPKPRILRTPEVIGMFKLFAELLAFHLTRPTERRVERESQLALEKKTAEVREQFIAVLAMTSEIRWLPLPAGCAAPQEG